MLKEALLTIFAISFQVKVPTWAILFLSFASSFSSFSYFRIVLALLLFVLNPLRPYKTLLSFNLLLPLIVPLNIHIMRHLPVIFITSWVIATITPLWFLLDILPLIKMLKKRYLLVIFLHILAIVFLSLGLILISSLRLNTLVRYGQAKWG